MKDIGFDYTEYNDDTILDMIIDVYNMDKDEKNIIDIWKVRYYLDYEYENNDAMNLSLIKKYSPEIYNSYDYTNKNGAWCDINLDICADILKRRFNNRFFKYINDLEGDELSGDDTDTDEY